jgi:hypothetical protein
MNQPDTNPSAASAAITALIDLACDRFEDAWQAGQRPHVENFLGKFEGPARTRLLVELLKIELNYRIKRGDTPTLQEYLARFPAQAAALRKQFLAVPAPACAGLPSSGAAETTLTESGTATNQAGSVPPAGTPTGTPAVVVPGYMIERELGRGAMGVVYKAQHLRLKRLVALKMILSGPHAAPQELARFRTEAEAVARLQHPHIVQIYDIGEHGGDPYLALEFVDGGSLAQKIRDTQLPPRQAALMVQPLAQAIHYAHERGVLHRDLKPANVLLVSGKYHPKIADFGLAKKLEEVGQTVSGAIMGTPGYMAPEQARGDTRVIGPPADVHALGAILYKLLTGRAPFHAETAVDTILQTLSRDPTPPRQLNPKVPCDLETICLKCMRKDPADRYASARALADDLERFLEDRPILARPLSRGERLVRWARRNPLVAGLLGVAAALLLLVAMGTAALVGLLAWGDKTQAQLTQAEEDRQKLVSQDRKRQDEEDERKKAKEKKEAAAKAYADYCEDMRAATKAMFSANGLQPGIKEHVEMQTLLHRNLPPPNKPDQRGWEWFYLNKRELIVSPIHRTLPGSRVIAVAWRDEKNVLALRYDWKQVGAELSVFDTIAGTEPAAAARYLPMPIFEESPYLTQDGRWLAYSISRNSRTWEMRIRNTLTHEEKVLQTGTWNMASARVSPDGTKLALTNAQGWLGIHDLKRDQFTRLDERRPGLVAWSADGQRLAADFKDSIEIWHIPSLKRIHTLKGHELPAAAAVFSPKGDQFASLCGKSMVIWDLETQTLIASVPCNDSFPRSLDWSPDGRRVAVADDFRIDVLETKQWQKVLTIEGSRAPIRWSPDGRRLVARLAWSREDEVVVHVANEREPPNFDSLKVHAVGSTGVNVKSLLSRHDRIGRIYQFGVLKAKQYVVEMESTDFHPSIRVEDKNGKFYADAYGRPARLVFRPQADGAFMVLARRQGGAETGAFRLSIREQPLDADLVKRHDVGTTELRFAHALTVNDPLITATGPATTGHFNVPAKTYYFNLRKNQIATFEVESTEIQPILLLVDGAAKVIRASGNSRIVFQSTDTGTFMLHVTVRNTHTVKFTGNYLLRVHARSADAVLAKAYEVDRSGELQIQSEITKADPTGESGSAVKLFRITMVRGKSYTIDLEASAFMPSLRLEGTDLTSSAIGNTARRLVFDPPQHATYVISAGSRGGVTGKFVLKIKERELAPELATVHDIASKELRIQSALTSDDPTEDGKSTKTYMVKFAKDQTYQVELVEPEGVGIYLNLRKQSGKENLARSFGSGSKQKAVIRFQAPEDGIYRVVVSRWTKPIDHFTLSVRVWDPGPEFTTVHEIDKQGRQFQNELTREDEHMGRVGSGNLRSKTYQVRLLKNNVYIMSVAPAQVWRVSLRLEEASGKAVASSGDAGNPRAPPPALVFSPAEDGTYRLIVMGSVFPDGKYTVEVRKVGPEPDRAKVHDLGKDGLEFGSTLRRKGGQKQDTQAKAYLVRLVKGRTYSFELHSSAFSPFLRVEDSNGKSVGFEIGGGITFQAPEDGTYRVIASSRLLDFRGAFTLKLREK